MGLAVAVGIFVSGCASPRHATTFPTTSTTTPTTTDPATNPYADVGPGSYRILASLETIDDPQSVAIDSGLGHAYITSSADESVYIVDTATQRVTGTVEIGVPTTSLQPMAIDPATHLVYLILNGSDRELVIIDPNTRSVIDKIEAGGDHSAVTIDPERHIVYVANRYHRTVTAIDTGTRAIVATIPVGGEPTAVAVDPNSHQLWVVTKNGVTVVDPGTYTVSATIPVDGSPQGIAIAAASRTAYVTRMEGHSVTLIDTEKRTAAGKIELGMDVSLGVAIDPTEHTVYVTSGAFESVTMIDTIVRKVTASRRLAKSPSCTEGIAVDTTTHHVYVTCESDRTVRVLAPE